jgi:hypothetical protein
MADLTHVELSYETRSGWCLDCPAFSLKLRSGWFDVKMTNGAVSEATLPLSGEAFRKLVDAFTKAQFFEIPRLDTQHTWFDDDVVTVAYRDQNRMHEVVDVNRRLPALNEVERQLLEAVNIQRFINPSLETYRSLVAAGWSPAGSRELALGSAARARDDASVVLLLDHGARPSEAILLAAMVPDDGGPASPAVARLLLSRGATVPAIILGRMLVAASGVGYAGPSGDTRVPALLLERGADANFQDFETGDTPLIRAAANNRRPTVALLLSRGAKIDAADRAGRTALMQAAERCRDQMVPDLLKAGADAKAVDRQGKTAFNLARAVSPECARVRSQLQGR